MKWGTYKYKINNDFNRGSTSPQWFFVYLIPGRIGIWKCWFLGRGENWSTQGKSSQSKQENQQQTLITHIWRQCRDLNPGHIDGRWVLSPLRYLCSSPISLFEPWNEEINKKKIIPSKDATYAVANRKPEKIQACWDWNPGLCDTSELKLWLILLLHYRIKLVLVFQRNGNWK